MPNRLIQLLLLAVALAGTGTIVATLSHGVATGRQAVSAGTAVIPSATPSIASTAVLPVVTVRAEAPIPTLGTITVRPGRNEPGMADALRSEDYAVDKIEPPSRISSGGSLQSAAFDMPYYSFGKTLRHVSKE
ncbi:MAG: hypothetical protein ACHP7D_09220 [Lysobacterales bacterium]